MSLATVISRMLGFGRDMVAAHLFGAGLISDAFLVAFRIPNLLRDLLAEGALSSAFVPALTKARYHGGDAESWRLASLMLSALGMILAGIVLLGLWAAPWILRVYAPGFEARPEQFALTVRLTRIVFPFLGFIGLSAVFMGMLNARKSFFVPAVAPAMMNVAMICFGLFICPRLGPDPEKEITGWAVGALVGGALQWLVQVGPAWRAGFRWRPRWPFGDPGVKRIFGTLVPAVVGQSTAQINLLVNTIIATHLAAGSITYLSYGARLMQLPLGVFGVAIAAAVLPDLAAAHASKDMGLYRRTLGFGLRLTLFTDLPALAGLVCLAFPIQVLLFKGGQFSLEDARNTAYASMAYTGGVVFASWVKVQVPAFYALDEPKVPVRVSMAMMLVNLGLNLALWKPFGFLGLAITASVVNLVQAVTLQVLLTRRTGRLWQPGDVGQAVKMVGATVAMAVVLLAAAWGVNQMDPGWETGAHGKLRLAGEVGGLMALGISSYISLTLLLGLRELVPARFWPQKASVSAARAQVAKESDSPYD